MNLNVINQCNEENYEPLMRKVLKKAYAMMHVKKKKVINIIFVTNETIRELNRTYRSINNTTDVLTFESPISEELGDIFIAPHVAMEQARAYGHSLKRELAFLAVHGFLHALGYDHDTKEKEHIMFSLQDQILNKVRLPR